jgi:ClpP class serine protease
MDGDGKMLIAETLDPLNNEFLATVKSNREGKLNLAKENVLTGKTYVSKQAIEYGLIDGIRAMEDIINQTRVQTKINTYSMTLETLKAEHPKLVEDVLAQEKDRVASWLKFNHVDSKAVAEGINSGKSLTQSETIEFLRKDLHAELKQGINADSKETPAKDGGAPVIETEPTSELDALFAQVRQQRETAKL